MSQVYQAIGFLVADRIYKADGCYDEESIMSLTGCNREFAEAIRDQLELQREEMDAISKGEAA